VKRWKIYINQRNVLHKSPYGLGMNSQLVKSCWCHRERWRHLQYVTHIVTFLINWHQKWVHKEYWISADNIIVFDHFCNLTKKSNLIGWLYCDLTQFFNNLAAVVCMCSVNFFKCAFRLSSRTLLYRQNIKFGLLFSCLPISGLQFPRLYATRCSLRLWILESYD